MSFQYLVVAPKEEGIPARAWLVASPILLVEPRQVLEDLGVEMTRLFGRTRISHLPAHAVGVAPKLIDAILEETGARMPTERPLVMRFYPDPFCRYGNRPAPRSSERQALYRRICELAQESTLRLEHNLAA